MKRRRIGAGHVQISDREKKYVLQVLDTNRLSAGPFTRRFESEFAERHGCRYGIMLNSGASALYVSVAALKELHGWNDSDEVLVPASTFVATSNVVFHNNLKPVFVDIDAQTYNIDPSLIPAAITPRTRAIIPVHLYGQPCSMDPILEIARAYNLRVIEDSCECMFVSYRGQRVGSFGDLACFSTYVAHILSTGVGGLITTNNEQYALMCRSIMAHGRDPIYLSIDDDDTSDLDRLREIVLRRFNFVRIGHSFRVTEMEAALGLGQLEQAEEFMKRREHVSELLTSTLRPLEDHLQLPTVATDREHAFMMYPLVCRAHVDRNELVTHLEAWGIETRFMMPLLSQPFYRELLGPDLEKQFPVAYFVTRQGFYVPSHHGMTDKDVAYIGEVLSKYFGVKRIAAKIKCL